MSGHPRRTRFRIGPNTPEARGGGQPAGYAIYDLQLKSLRRLQLTSGTWDDIAGWLPDSRSLVLRGPTGVVIYDTVAGTAKTILVEPAFSSYTALRLARNGEVLMAQHEILDSEIWLFDFE